ncbi:MAG: hypothetical protein EP344_10385 [Bacteroidetes bacterium]|nr:MAG: hypothetical protein EP344_10385 [Bacteroidota bacterium]
MMKPTRSYIYLLSFLEGGAVMACELIGAKMLAPFFGTSLYVWAAALGLTLGGLMTGYFAGGILSRRSSNNLYVLYWVLILAGLTLFLMPFTSHWIMNITLGLPLQAGATLALLVFMFPPLVFMGMVSPLIINILTEVAVEAGNRAGNVYAISTLGGILVTFLMGFVIIPEYGISVPAMVCGLLLATLPAFSLFRLKVRTAPLLWLLMVAGFIAMGSRDMDYTGDRQVHYYSEGILGQIKVLDFDQAHNGQAVHRYRGLVMNNTLQTVLNLEDPDAEYWGYTRLIGHLSAQYPPGSRMLVLGLGGGTLARRLRQLQFEVEAVEIDARLVQVAKQYFDLQAEIPVYLDDARHFIRTTPKKYDVIIYDIFRGESAPEHVLTRESLEDTRDNLAAGGLLLINFYGYWDGPRGEISRSVFKTLNDTGFNSRVVATDGSEDRRNLVFLAQEKSADNEHPLSTFTLPVDTSPLRVLPNDTTNVVVLTDEQPQLQLYGQVSAQWRKLYNDFYISQFSNKK